MAIVIGIIGILAVLSLPVIGKLRARAQRLQCMVNLRNLHVAAALYVQDNNQWPQIVSGSEDEDDSSYAREWIAALAPYHLEKKSWICPTTQSFLGNPDYMSVG